MSFCEAKTAKIKKMLDKQGVLHYNHSVAIQRQQVAIIAVSLTPAEVALK